MLILWNTAIPAGVDGSDAVAHIYRDSIYAIIQHKLCINSGVGNQTRNSNAAHYAAEMTHAHPDTLLLIGSAEAVLVLYYTIWFLCS